MSSSSSAALAEALITVPDLNRLLGVLQCDYEVDIRCDRDGFWTVEFVVETRKYMLATSAGSRRGWRQLEPVFFFLKRECQACRQIRLHIAKWMLSSDRQSKERSLYSGS
ncbi:hypothetical protein [Cupriavidus sp. CP313]